MRRSPFESSWARRDSRLDQSFVMSSRTLRPETRLGVHFPLRRSVQASLTSVNFVGEGGGSFFWLGGESSAPSSIWGQ